MKGEGMTWGMQWLTERKTKHNEGMVCDGVIAYVCVLTLCAHVCVCKHVSSQDSTRAHTHALVIVNYFAFL